MEIIIEEIKSWLEYQELQAQLPKGNNPQQIVQILKRIHHLQNQFCQKLQSDINKTRCQNLRIFKQLKQLKQKQIISSSNNNNTASQFMMASQFKQKWQAIIKQNINITFSQWFQQPHLFAKNIIMVIKEVYSQVKQRISTIINKQLQQFGLDENYYSILFKCQLKFFQDNNKTIFKQSKKLKSFQTLNIQEQEATSLIQKLYQLCIYMQLQTQQLALSDPYQSVFNKKEHICIDGFVKQNEPVTVILQVKKGQKQFCKKGVVPFVGFLHKLEQIVQQKEKQEEIKNNQIQIKNNKEEQNNFASQNILNQQQDKSQEQSVVVDKPKQTNIDNEHKKITQIYCLPLKNLDIKEKAIKKSTESIFYELSFDQLKYRNSKMRKDDIVGVIVSDRRKKSLGRIKSSSIQQKINKNKFQFEKHLNKQNKKLSIFDQFKQQIIKIRNNQLLLNFKEQDFNTNQNRIINKNLMRKKQTYQKKEVGFDAYKDQVLKKNISFNFREFKDQPYSKCNDLIKQIATEKVGKIIHKTKTSQKQWEEVQQSNNIFKNKINQQQTVLFKNKQKMIKPFRSIPISYKENMFKDLIKYKEKQNKKTCGKQKFNQVMFFGKTQKIQEQQEKSIIYRKTEQNRPYKPTNMLKKLQQQLMTKNI